MYKLELSNEELHTLRGILETHKSRTAYPFWDETCNAVLLKVTLSQIDLEEEARREAQAERYAANLHSAPKGA